MSECVSCYKRDACDWIEPPQACMDYRPRWAYQLQGLPMYLMLPGVNKPLDGRITAAADDFFIFHSNGRDYVVDYVCDYTLRRV